VKKYSKLNSLYNSLTKFNIFATKLNSITQPYSRYYECHINEMPVCQLEKIPGHFTRHFSSGAIRGSWVSAGNHIGGLGELAAK